MSRNVKLLVLVTVIVLAYLYWKKQQSTKSIPVNTGGASQVL